MPIVNTPPNTLTNGTAADASAVMANFNQIVSNVNANAAANGANSDITALTGLTTALGRTYGGSQFYTGGTSTGSGNAQVVSTLIPLGISLVAGATVSFTAGFTNSGATQLNLGGTGLKDLFRQTRAGAVACIGNEIIAGQIVLVIYDGTQWELVNQSLIPTATLFSLAALTLAAGDLLVGSGVNTASVLAIGGNNSVLGSNGSTASWVTTLAGLTSVTTTTLNATTNLQFNGTAIPYRRRFQGAFSNSWALSTTLPQAHGLGGVPRLESLRAIIQNTSGGTLNNWANGDQFLGPSQVVYNSTVSSNDGIALYADATNVVAIFSQVLYLPNKINGNLFNAGIPANWGVSLVACI